MDRVLLGSGSRIEDTLTSPSKDTSPPRRSKKRRAQKNSYRFNLDLTQGPGSQGFFEFNWLDLITQQGEKTIASKKKEIEEILNSRNDEDPYWSDNEEQLRSIEKKFETKYRGALKKLKKTKKERKLNDFADLGYGYDSNDSFIDNSDVHEEMVPTNITTAHGGFYINCGNLEFKHRESADEDSDSEQAFQDRDKTSTGNNRKRRKKTDQSLNSESVQPGSSSLMNLLLGEDSSSKQRIRKEGAKPLGRPKKRNPDGTLVHPPKPPRQPKLDSQGKVIKKLSQGDFKLKRVNKVLPPGSTNVFTGKPLNTGSGEKQSESNSDSPVKSQATGTQAAVLSKPKTEASLSLNSKELNEAAMLMLANFHPILQMAKTMQKDQRRDATGHGSGLLPKKSPPKHDSTNTTQVQGASKVATSIETLIHQRNGVKLTSSLEKPKIDLLKKKTIVDTAKNISLESLSPKSLKDIYNMYAVKMEEAIKKGDKAGYERLNDEVKEICNSLNSKKPKAPKPQQAVTKAANSTVVSKSLVSSTNLPNGITIESVSSSGKRDHEVIVSSVAQKPTESTLTLSAVQPKPPSVSIVGSTTSLPKSQHSSTITHLSLPLTKGMNQREDKPAPNTQLSVFTLPTTSSGIIKETTTKGFTLTPSQPRLPFSVVTPTSHATQLTVSPITSSNTSVKLISKNELPKSPCFQKTELDLSIGPKVSDGFGLQQSKLKVKNVSSLMEPQPLVKDTLSVSCVSPRSDQHSSSHSMKKEGNTSQVPEVLFPQQPISFQKESISSANCVSTSSLSISNSRLSAENIKTTENKSSNSVLNYSSHASKANTSDVEKHQGNTFADFGMTFDLFTHTGSLTSALAPKATKEASMEETLKSLFAHQQPLSKKDCPDQSRTSVAPSKVLDSVIDFSIESIKQSASSNPLQTKKETALALQIHQESTGHSFLPELPNKNSYPQQASDPFIKSTTSSASAETNQSYSSFDAELAALVSELASSAGQASDFAKAMIDEQVQMTQPLSDHGNSKSSNIYSNEKESSGLTSSAKSDSLITVPQMQPLSFSAQNIISGFSSLPALDQRQQNSPSASNQQLLHVTTIPTDQTKNIFQRQLQPQQVQQRQGQQQMVPQQKQLMQQQQQQQQQIQQQQKQQQQQQQIQQQKQRLIQQQQFQAQQQRQVMQHQPQFHQQQNQQQQIRHQPQQTLQPSTQPKNDSTIFFTSQPIGERPARPQLVQHSQSQQYGQQKVTVYGTNVQPSSPLSGSKVPGNVHMLPTSSPSQMISTVSSVSSQPSSFCPSSPSVLVKSTSITKPTVSLLSSQPSYVTQQNLSKPHVIVSQATPSFTVSNLSQVSRSPSHIGLSSSANTRVVPVSNSISNSTVGYYQTSVSSSNQGITGLPSIMIPAGSVISQQLMGNPSTSYFNPSGNSSVEGQAQITLPSTLFKGPHQNHIIHFQHPNQQHHSNNY